MRARTLPRRPDPRHGSPDGFGPPARYRGRRWWKAVQRRWQPMRALRRATPRRRRHRGPGPDGPKPAPSIRVPAWPTRGAPQGYPVTRCLVSLEARPRKIRVSVSDLWENGEFRRPRPDGGAKFPSESTRTTRASGTATTPSRASPAAFLGAVLTRRSARVSGNKAEYRSQGRGSDPSKRRLGAAYLSPPAWPRTRVTLKGHQVSSSPHG